MQLIEWSVGLGGRVAPKTNEILLQHLPEYDKVSRILPFSKDLSHAVQKCEHFGGREAKFIYQLDPISFDSPCRLVIPNFCFARQRDRGELHRKVFWFEPGMVEF